MIDFVKEHKTVFVLILISLLALLIRIVAFSALIDSPGDGPVRAIKAFKWAASPSFWVGGVWGAGHTILAGLFYYVVKDPLYSTRLLNLIIGTFTIPIFGLLISKTFSASIGYICAFLLAVLPLHVFLSVSSLTEPLFLFEIILCTFLFIRALDFNNKLNGYLIEAFLIIYYAQLTRTESWIMAIVYPIFYFFITKKPLISLLLFVSIFLIPFVWIYQDYISFHEPLMVFRDAVSAPINYSSSVGIIPAINILIKHLNNHLGWGLFLLCMFGVGYDIYLIASKKSTFGRALFLAVAGIFWGFMIVFTMFRGEKMFDRYLLLGIVMLLPYAYTAVQNHLNSKGTLIICMFISLLLVDILKYDYIRSSLNMPHNAFWVSLKRPVEIEQILTWINKSPDFRDSSILTSEINWQGTYISMLQPNFIWREYAVNNFNNDQQVEYFINTQKPLLFITCNNRQDIEQKNRLENILDKKIHKSRLLFQSGDYQVYDLRGLVNYY